MKTTITSRVIALAMLVLPTAYLAQSELYCMQELKTSEASCDSNLAATFDLGADEANGSIHFSPDDNKLRYRLPTNTAIASILVLKASGEVFAEYPLSASDDNTIGESILNTSDLPAGKYYITLLTDYAVADSKQFIKVQ